jgi:hypothetical protein
VKPLGPAASVWAGDAGRPDPQLRAALAASTEPEGYARAVAALCLARLLLPIAPDPDGDLSAVSVTAPDGRTGLLAFTGLDSLVEWRADARPVPCTLDDVAATAVETGAVAVVVDLAGPVPLVIEEALVAELAAGRRLVELPDGGFGWLFADAGSPPPAAP